MNDINLDKERADAGLKFAIEAIKQLPKDDKAALEYHITGVLVMFWGALWGTFGTEYARAFIERQLHTLPPADDAQPPMQ